MDDSVFICYSRECEEVCLKSMYWVCELNNNYNFKISEYNLE